MLTEDHDEDEGSKKARRRAYLVQFLAQNHYISLEEVATRFSVTVQTARRDIKALERQGKVRRLHGGAVASTPLDPLIYRQRRVVNAERKEAIGRRVADLLPDKASVFIDTGTTCEAVARALVARRGLRVVTYSLRVATTLSEATDFTIAVPGGFVRQVDAGVFSQNASEFIRAFKFDYVIISVSGIDDDGDIGDDDYAEVAAVRAAILQAGRVILAIDSSKLGHRALVKLGSVDEVDIIVCDAAPTGNLMQILKKSRAEFHLAEIPAKNTERK